MRMQENTKRWKMSHEHARLQFWRGSVTDLRDVAQLLQGGGGGRGRRRVALLHQVGEVAHVAVTPDAVALGVAASPPLLRRLGWRSAGGRGRERKC